MGSAGEALNERAVTKTSSVSTVAQSVPVTVYPPTKSYLQRWEFWGLLATAVAAALTPVFAIMTVRQALIGVGGLLFISLAVEVDRLRRRAAALERDYNTLASQLGDALRKNQDLGIKLTKAKTEFLLIEELPLSSLMVELESRAARKVNPVRVEEFTVRCKWKGAGPVRDAEVSYKIAGTNLSGKPLPELHLSIDGDNLVPLASLNATYFDLISDPSRSKPMKPILRGKDGISKHIALEFVLPGVPAYEAFSLEFSYTWPAVFNSPKNYWFLHTLDFQETHGLLLEIDVGTVQSPRVQAYSITVDPVEINNIGRIHPDAGAVPLYVFRKRPPEKDSLYLLVVDGE
jgi:hypothetical protein